MELNLTDEQTAALLRELDHIIENHRFPLSPCIQTLKGILAKIRRIQKVYAPPRAKGRRRRG